MKVRYGFHNLPTPFPFYEFMKSVIGNQVKLNKKNIPKANFLALTLNRINNKIKPLRKQGTKVTLFLETSFTALLLKPHFLIFYSRSQSMKFRRDSFFTGFLKKLRVAEKSFIQKVAEYLEESLVHY